MQYHSVNILCVVAKMEISRVRFLHHEFTCPSVLVHDTKFRIDKSLGDMLWKTFELFSHDKETSSNILHVHLVMMESWGVVASMNHHSVLRILMSQLL